MKEYTVCIRAEKEKNPQHLLFWRTVYKYILQFWPIFSFSFHAGAETFRPIFNSTETNWRFYEARIGLSYLQPVEKLPLLIQIQINMLTRLSFLIYSSFSSKTDPFLSVCLRRRHSVMLKAKLSACNVASSSGCFPLQILQT